MRPQSWNFFLQIGLTESMVSCAEKDREIIPLTWRNCWKVALKIRGFWPENEGKNCFRCRIMFVFILNPVERYAFRLSLTGVK